MEECVSGFGASMQSTSFLPGFYPRRDLNVCDNGGVWTLYKSEKTLNNVHSRNVLSPLPTKHQFSVYEKKALRQTILQHESIFREQVRKLHRLHRRQRELMMDEIKRRTLFDQNLNSESTASENFRSTSNFSEISCFKCEKPKKKLLDLELPAEEYSDSEEKDQFGNERVSKVSELRCYPTKGIEEVLQKSDVEFFRADPFPCRDYDLADLNETLGFKGAVASISMDLNMPPIGLLDSEISQQNHEDLQAVLPTPGEKLQDLSNKPNKEREDTPHKDTKRLKTSDVCNAMDNIDLNCCINEDEPSPKLFIPAFNKTVEEIDLEAPVSPENEECSPPRGESEGNSLETPVKLSKQEGDGEEYQKDELVRMAAEAIVLMSTPRFSKLLLQNIVCERLEGCSNDSLDWFAEVVSSLAGNLGNESVLRRHLGTSICSPLEQQNIDSSTLGERSLKGWGKVNRRRRGPRIPSSNISPVFG